MGSAISFGLCQSRVRPKDSVDAPSETDEVGKVTVVNVSAKDGSLGSIKSAPSPVNGVAMRTQGTDTPHQSPGDGLESSAVLLLDGSNSAEAKAGHTDQSGLESSKGIEDSALSNTGQKSPTPASGSNQNSRVKSIASESASDSRRSTSAGMLSPAPNTKGRFSLSFRGSKINKADFADQITNSLHEKLVQEAMSDVTEYSKRICADINAQIRLPFICGDFHGLTFCNNRLGHRVCSMLVESIDIQELSPYVACICLRNNNLTSHSISMIYQGLHNFSHLTKLDLSCNPLGNAGVHLALDLFPKIPTMLSINLSHVGATDDCVSHVCTFLRNPSAIQELSLVSNHFSDDGINQIISAAGSSKTIHLLNLEGSPGYSDKSHKQLEGILAKNQAPKQKTSPFEWECHPDKDPTPIGSLIMPDGSLSIPTQTAWVAVENITVIDQEDWSRKPMFTKSESYYVAESAPPRPLSYISYTNEVIAAMNELGLRQNHLNKGRFLIGQSETIGRRINMEDRIVVLQDFMGQKGWCLISLFDGHGGVDASNYAAEQVPQTIGILFSREGFDADPANIIRRAFVDVNDSMSGFLFCGTTALVALIIDDNLYMACAGDSRAVLSRGGEVVRVSKDHKPGFMEEKVRIAECGGFVKDGRVNGVLSVSRSLGDSFLHPIVSCEPYLTMTKLELRPKKGNGATEETRGDAGFYDEFLIMGCDGVWDVLSDYEAATIAHYANFRERPELAAESIRNSAFRLGSADNISVLVVALDSGAHG